MFGFGYYAQMGVAFRIYQEMYDEIIEAFRNPFFFFVYVSVLLSFVSVSGAQLGDTVELEFQAYRLQQYEFNGNTYGSRTFRIAYEAVSLDSQMIRRCTVTSWRDLAGSGSMDKLMSSSVGALLIIIPDDLDALSEADRKYFSSFEKYLSTVKTELAVYVTPSNERTTAILADVAATGGKASTATQQLISAVAANSFQFSSTGNPSATPLTYQPQNVIARLNSGDRSAPTIAFVAHYDSHASFPGIAVGADSNGSGVVALLELLAILKKFYDKPSTRPPYNLVFVWTAGGKYNFQGARQFVDEWNDGNGNTNRKLELVVCVEALAGPGSLKMHVGKAPGENSAAGTLLRRLQATQDVEVVPKKINLNQPLAWEHERFNMKRLPAVTISRLSSHESDVRRSVLDTSKSLDIEQLTTGIRSLAEAVLGYVLRLPEGGAFKDSRVEADQSMLSKDAVDQERISFNLKQFASSARPLSDPSITNSITANLAATAQNYAKVTVSPVTLQEVKVWGGVVDRLLAERVKPAVFELLIAAGVIVYLGVFYQFIGKAQKTIEGTVQSLRR